MSSKSSYPSVPFSLFHSVPSVTYDVISFGTSLGILWSRNALKYAFVSLTAATRLLLSFVTRFAKFPMLVAPSAWIAARIAWPVSSSIKGFVTSLIISLLYGVVVYVWHTLPLTTDSPRAFHRLTSAVMT